MKIITLTDEEINQAIFQAEKIDLECKRRNIRDKHGYAYYSKELKYKNSKEGFMAEVAVSKLLNLEWSSPKQGNTCKGPDVGLDIQVRSTNRIDGRLIIRPDDFAINPNHKFILVIRNDIPNFAIIGYIFGKDAPDKGWWGCLDPKRSDNPAWNISQEFLNPIEDLIK